MCFRSIKWRSLGAGIAWAGELGPSLGFCQFDEVEGVLKKLGRYWLFEEAAKLD